MANNIIYRDVLVYNNTPETYNVKIKHCFNKNIFKKTLEIYQKL